MHYAFDTIRVMRPAWLKARRRVPKVSEWYSLVSEVAF